MPPRRRPRPTCRGACRTAATASRHEQSGQRDRSRLSKQGCPPLRRYLYLAALSAVRFDPELKAPHATLVARGKAAKSATCAVAHKLLPRLMAGLRDAREPRHAGLPLAA